MFYIFFKRTVDIILSTLAIIVLLPLFIPVIFLLKITGDGEVFYFQERIGYKNSTFRIWKFATMVKDSPNIGSRDITLRNDPRVTKFGVILRRTKINELPQLVNIILGDLSIVGPRPLMKSSFAKYSQKIQNKIYNVKPGLTGIGSIVFRDEESIISAVEDEDPHEYYKRVIAPHKGDLEIWYQSNRSFILDIKIIFLTAWVIIFRQSRLFEKMLKDFPKRSF
tara:strand:- start:429 stop:1097 length:669 start_codon:yes stop_codon:yes gene_type:complete